MKPEVGSRIGAVADWCALACFALMACVPFLIARHYNPIPSFWSEWWAFAFGLGASAFVLVRPGAWRPMALPGVVFIPFALLAMALLQYALGRWHFIEPWLLYAAYLLWASLLILAAHSIAARRGMAALAYALSFGLLAGALLNTAAAALQYHGVGFRSGWVFIRLGAVPYSNLGQPNHFNHELWLGIASLYYLHVRGVCRLRFAIMALAILLFAATMSASKSILLYAIAFTMIAGFMFRKHAGDASARRLWHLSLPLLPLVLLLQWLADAAGIAGTGSLPLATQRLFEQVDGFRLRWRLIQAAWDAFLQAPLLGHGIGAMPWQFFTSNNKFPLGDGPGVAEHAHNILLQLLAEFGIVPVVIAAMLLMRWLIDFMRRDWRSEHWWVACALAIGGIHSLLEYPLWYAFFLGIAAALLGASDRAVMSIHNGMRGAVLSTLVIAAGIVPLISLRADYSTLEKRVNNLVPVASAASNWEATVRDLLAIQRDSLLAPYVMLSLAGAMEADDKQLADKVEVCRQASRFAPTHRILFKCAALMAMKGETAEANTLMRQSLDAYPFEAARAARELDEMSKTYPAVRALAAMAHAQAQAAASVKKARS